MENESNPSTPDSKPSVIEITDDMTMVRCLLACQIEALEKSPKKSRERALVITKLQEASMWANEENRKNG